MSRISLIDNLYDSLNSYGHKPAIRYKNLLYTFEELIQNVERIAAGLDALGLLRGKRAAIMLPNIPEYIFLYYALLRQGIEIIPINILLKSSEINHILADSEAHALIAWDKFSDQILPALEGIDGCTHQIYFGETTPPGGINFTEFLQKPRKAPHKAELQPDDVALIYYTAGISARPRGAVLSHSSLVQIVNGIQETFLFNSADKVLAVLPLFNSLGQIVGVNVPHTAGACVSLLPKFKKENVLQTIIEDEITVLPGIPSIFESLIDIFPDKPVDHKLRLCIASGAPLSEKVLHAFENRVRVPIIEGYGLSECSPLVTANRIYREQRTGTVGWPLPEIDLKILDENDKELPPNEVGEIYIRGPQVMKYYLNRPESTKAVLKHGWLQTGDVGMVDNEGYLHLVDRKKDLILKGGFHIYPKEVEAILNAHPKVAQSAVVGIQVSRTNEIVQAYIVLKQGQTATAEEIMAYCQDKVAIYKCPEKIAFLDELPRSSSGKILKRTLREQFTHS